MPKHKHDTIRINMGDASLIHPDLLTFADTDTNDRGHSAAFGAGAGLLVLSMLVSGCSTTPKPDNTPKCGFSIVKEGGGYLSIIEEATADAGMKEEAANQGDVIVRLQELSDPPQPGQRYIMYVVGNRVLLDTVQMVGSEISSCADFEAAQRQSTPPGTSPASTPQQS